MTARSTRRHVLAAIGVAAVGAMATTGAASGAHPDAELLALLAEFDALELKINPPGVRFGTIEAEETHDAAVEPLKGRQKQVLTALCTARATTLDGFRARALSLISWDYDMRKMIADGDAPDDYHDDQMIFALVRDLVSGGAA